MTWLDFAQLRGSRKMSLFLHRRYILGDLRSHNQQSYQRLHKIRLEIFKHMQGSYMKSLDKLCTGSQLLSSTLSIVIESPTGHCLLDILTQCIGNMASEVCRTSRNMQGETIILQLLGLCPALCLRRNKQIGVCYFNDLLELTCRSIGWLNA